MQIHSCLCSLDGMCNIIVVAIFLEIFFVFLPVLNVNGCEGFTHPWEGRDALGEGVSWAQQCS